MEAIELSSDDDEIVETLRVLWNEPMKIHWFDIGRKEPLQKVFKLLAKEYQLNPEEVLLVRNGTEIYPSDSIHSLNISVLDEIVALKNNAKDFFTELTTPGGRKIKIKVQEKDVRKPLVFYLCKDQPVHLLIRACAKQLKLPEDKISIKFDGDVLMHSDTLNSLDIDNEVVMDLFINK